MPTSRCEAAQVNSFTTQAGDRWVRHVAILAGAFAVLLSATPSHAGKRREAEIRAEYGPTVAR